jgi:hypothetical protein
MQVFPYLKTIILTEYHSKEDLVHAIATSCHIPAYCDGSFVKEFRGQVRIKVIQRVKSLLPLPPAATSLPTVMARSFIV